MDTGEPQTPNCARLIEATATDIIETTWLPQRTPSNLESQIQVSMTNTKATAAGALEQTSSTSAGKKEIIKNKKENEKAKWKLNTCSKSLVVEDKVENRKQSQAQRKQNEREQDDVSSS